MLKVKVAVLVSGGGTNLQAILDALESGVIKHAEICRVISNKADAYALERARNHAVPSSTVIRGESESREAFEERLIAELDACGAELIVLAGFMHILGRIFIERYRDRIINVHPSLIPSFCGKGFYGLKVHEAALEYGVKVSGATVHFVNEIPDGGKIILQKAVPVMKNDTPKKLQARIMKQAEWKILPRAVELVAKDIIKNK